ncbi:MAG: DUF2249 domain-containing protein [Tissierellaceae bacterium]
MSTLQIDTRGYEIEDINDIVIKSFDHLPVGEKMVLINDYNPINLFNELEDRRFGKFEWDYMEEGPDIWKVSLAKKYLNYI